MHRVQELWSGYGEISRIGLTASTQDRLILKRVDPPTEARHPRGFDTTRSHERKLHSYEVERCFYARSSTRF